MPHAASLTLLPIWSPCSYQAYLCIIPCYPLPSASIHLLSPYQKRVPHKAQLSSDWPLTSLLKTQPRVCSPFSFLHGFKRWSRKANLRTQERGGGPVLGFRMAAGRQELELRRSEGKGQGRLSLLTLSPISHCDLSLRQMEGHRALMVCNPHHLCHTLKPQWLTFHPLSCLQETCTSLKRFREVLGLSPLRKPSPGISSLFMH